MALRPHITTPDLTIQSVDADVPEGVAASFLITASAAPGVDTTVNLGTGGTAGNSDIVTPPTSVGAPGRLPPRSRCRSRPGSTTS